MFDWVYTSAIAWVYGSTESGEEIALPFLQNMH